MVRFIKKIRNFQFKGILMILGCFILIAAALFAERSGVQYQEKKRQISYIRLIMKNLLKKIKTFN